MDDPEKKLSPQDVKTMIESVGHSLSPAELESLCVTLDFVAGRARRCREGIERSDEPATAFRVSVED